MTSASSDAAGALTLSPLGSQRVAAGHLWIYEGHIARLDGQPAAGDVVDVRDASGRFRARGFFNPRSKIRVRILSSRQEPIDRAFWERGLARAVRLRERVVAGADAYRLVYAEADALPGLIVDRYGSLLVMQTLSFGMDARKALLADLLVTLTKADFVYERNDTKTRSLEGMPSIQGFLRGQGSTRIEIREGTARFTVDVAKGQKTGWFCDQRENRSAAAPLAHGARVLDAFCHSGAFGIHAALHGAEAVEGLDSSAEAVAAASAHAELNDVAAVCRYRQADVFEELPTLVRAGQRFDLIILDPPAFAKTKHQAAQALAGYKQINLRALQLLNPDGFLVSCSCSHHVGEQALLATILDAGRDAGRQLRVVETRSQGRDHPVLGAMPETRYLKCFILQC